MHGNAALDAIGLPSFDQIGFVVRDLEDAMARYAPLFGEMWRTDYGPQMARFRGGPRSEYRIHFAFARVNGIEIELIQWISGETPHREFIEAGREGMHHLRFRIDDLAYWIAKLGTLGYENIWSEDIEPGIGFAYLERPGDPLLIELLQYTVTGDPTKARS